MLQINNKDKRFKSLDFVLQSVEKKDKLREVLYNKVYFTELRIYGADGYRLNSVTNTFNDLELGLYDVIKHTKTEIILIKSSYIGKYPDVQSIIDQTKNYGKQEFKMTNSSIHIFTYFIMNKLGICIDIDLLNDIYKFIPSNEVIDVYYNELSVNKDEWTYDTSIKVEWFDDVNDITYKSLLMAIRIKK